ncbi:transcription factor Pcc1 [Scheffersomyces coipomensis]|uniref:transcription factor Pcc1 n=1 Tax=Scheffersomyces coipomensis TaxID=1788519 RepID=UPI00315DC8C4
MDSITLPYSLQLEVPFETAKQAIIAASTLSPDPILKPNEVSVNYKSDENKLICQFQAVSDRVIRVAVSNVIENIKTIIECIDEFDGKEDQYFN